MRHWFRALTTLVAAATAGFLLWYVPHFDRWSTGGYWGVIAVMAVAGGLIGLSRLHGRAANATARFLVSFLPVFVAAGWVILAAQPRGNWIRDHVLAWSGDLGIDHVAHNLGEHVAVVAFGAGVVFGVTFEPKMFRRHPKRAEVGPTPAAAAPTLPPLAAGAEEEELAPEPPTARQAEADRESPEAPPA